MCLVLFGVKLVGDFLFNSNSFEKKSSLCGSLLCRKTNETIDVGKHLHERQEAADRTRPGAPEKRWALSAKDA